MHHQMKTNEGGVHGDGGRPLIHRDGLRGWKVCGGGKCGSSGGRGGSMSVTFNNGGGGVVKTSSIGSREEAIGGVFLDGRVDAKGGGVILGVVSGDMSDLGGESSGVVGGTRL
nr:hypothetical protein [Tanacetum cinerariifolium]